MLKQSDYVVTHITHTYGGASFFAQKAKKLKRIIVEI
jgi:hypothetical protein